MEHILAPIHSVELSVNSVGLKTWNPIRSLSLMTVMPLSASGQLFFYVETATLQSITRMQVGGEGEACVVWFGLFF